MYKISAVLVLILVLPSKGTSSLCSVKKSEGSCRCRRVVQPNAFSIVSEADCTYTNLQTIPSQNDLSDDLNHLDLRHNEIEKLESKFTNCTVKTLLLSYNQISFISEEFFQQMPYLTNLDLSYNNLTSLVKIFEKNGKLVTLNLSFNHIKTLGEDIFLPLIELQFLDLSYNEAELGGWLSENPTKLGINKDAILSLNLDNLGLNNLTHFYFDNYTQLKHLSLADNHFEKIPFIPSTVEYLDLSGSDVTVLQAKHLSFHSVKTLKLDRMSKLESIHHYAFYNMLTLEDLSIKNCRNLKEINELLFGLLNKHVDVHLKRLSLSGNLIQTLNSTYRFLFKKLDFIDLIDNPWRCDCDILWLQEFDGLYRSEKIKCSTPARVSSKSLIDLVDRDVPSCYPEKYGKKSHRVLIAVLCVMVIVLSALVAYLIYFNPKLYGNRRLGPQSPYSPTPLGEE